MRTNNMLIALYFAFSVALLLFTRTMAGSEEDLMLGEQLTTGSTTVSGNTGTKANPSQKPAKEKERTTQSTEPIKTTSTTRSTESTTRSSGSDLQGTEKNNKKTAPKQQ